MTRATRSVAVAALGLALTLALAGCDDGDRGPAARPDTTGGTGPTTGPTTGAASDGDTSPATPPSGTGTGPTPSTTPGGPAGRPTVLEPRTRLLHWQATRGSVHDSVTTNGAWTLVVDEAGRRAELRGPGTSSGWSGDAERVSDALLDEDYAVVVLQDKQEQHPSRAVVTDLASGRQFTLDGRSDVPTTNGGTWALGDGRLVHATLHRGAYCTATVDLSTRTSRLGWCAPPRHGFNSARVSPAGESLTTFDDSQPSCRSVVRLDGTRVERFPGVPRCHGWEGVLGDGGAVWSVIPNERRVETAHFYARSGDGYYDLGPGSSGTLAWCAGAAYFSRDPQRHGEPARLMRWSADDGLSVAYESPAGQAFLAAPRCGGDALTISAFAQAHDEQVSADLR